MKTVCINNNVLFVSDVMRYGGEQCESCGSWKETKSTTVGAEEVNGKWFVQTGYRYARKNEARGYVYCRGCGAEYRIMA